MVGQRRRRRARWHRRGPGGGKGYAAGNGGNGGGGGPAAGCRATPEAVGKVARAETLPLLLTSPATAAPAAAVVAPGCSVPVERAPPAGRGDRLQRRWPRRTRRQWRLWRVAERRRRGRGSRWRRRALELPRGQRWRRRRRWGCRIVR
ncbi:hypothetical protein BZL30_2443 [Mycobacterium kansasii]|uniref:Uncharacterized protein n=1 Tax=Mycobacterium kansasii TaxID=1768 RepID=A0A1V3XHG1_MYCKA|nr:hypothetical protein BZL30_2443 [Mycobacterium kansasii]